MREILDAALGAMALFALLFMGCLVVYGADRAASPTGWVEVAR